MTNFGPAQYFTGDEPYAPLEFTPPLSPDSPSDGPRCRALVAKLFKHETGIILELDECQVKEIDSILELYPPGHAKAGQYRFKQAIISIPRRNGKSTVTAVLALFSLIASNAPTIGVLAATKEQAKEVFDGVKYNFETNPALTVRFKCTHYKGIESRRPDKPAHFKIYAGDGNSLQGITFSGIIPVVVDELHITSATAYDAAVKGASVGQSGPVIGITTAGTDKSDLLKRLYESGRLSIAGGVDANERFGFWHWYVPADIDLWDYDALLRANPAAYFGRIDLEQEILEGKSNPTSNYSEYRRYRRNEFVSAEDLWLPLDVFAAAGGEGITRDFKQNYTGSYIVAVDKSPHWDYASITLACKVDDKIYTKRIARLVNPSLEWLEQCCLYLYNTYLVDTFVTSGRALKDLVINLREQHGLPAEYLTDSQTTTATTMIGKMIKERRVVHDNRDPIIKQQLPKTVTVLGPEGIRISVEKSAGPIDAVRSLVMACYQAEKTEPTYFAPIVF